MKVDKKKRRTVQNLTSTLVDLQQNTRSIAMLLICRLIEDLVKVLSAAASSTSVQLNLARKSEQDIKYCMQVLPHPDVPDGVLSSWHN